MRRVVGPWFTSSSRRRGRDQQSTRVSGQKSGSLITVESQDLLVPVFPTDTSYRIFPFAHCRTRKLGSRWESLAHVSTSVRTNDRAAAVATDSPPPHCNLTHPSVDRSPIRAESAHGKRPALPSVLPTPASRPRPPDDRLAPEPPLNPTNAV